MSEQYARIERSESASGELSLLKDMRVERGTKDDWEALHELHYKAEGKVVGRIWRCMLGDQLVAVAVVSSPRLLIAGRHVLFPKLKPHSAHDTKSTNTYRAQLVNKKFILCSRIVVDTLFRAGGISYRMLNLIARMEGREFMEIQSSMSKFNPFAIKAGFQFVKPREAAAYEKGLKMMRRHFSSHPADHTGVVEEIMAMPEGRRQVVLDQLRHFYYKNSALEQTGGNLGAGTSRVDEMEIAPLVKNIQQLVFGSPMYGVYRNPDVGSELPDSLPLSAFDNQLTTEKLVLK